MTDPWNESGIFTYTISFTYKKSAIHGGSLLNISYQKIPWESVVGFRIPWGKRFSHLPGPDSGVFVPLGERVAWGGGIVMTVMPRQIISTGGFVMFCVKVVFFCFPNVHPCSPLGQIPIYDYYFLRLLETTTSNKITFSSESSTGRIPPPPKKKKIK